MIDSDGIVKIGSVGGVSVINMWAKHKAFRGSAPGYALDRTQSTPELRSPQRIEAASQVQFGLTIPRFTLSDFKTHYMDKWTYNRPRGLNGAGQGSHEFYRLPDFDGYLHNCYWLLGGSGRNLYTIFNGSFAAADTLVYQGDSLRFDIQCCEDPDAGLPGLLYPYTFYRDQLVAGDISRYYMGIALLDASNDLWVLTGDDMRSHHTQNDIDASLLTALPANFPEGQFKAIPILATEISNPDPNTGDPRWTKSQTGYLVSLNGAYINLRAGSSYRQLGINVEISVNGRYITMDFMIRNITNSNVTVYGLDSYILSRASRSNEPDTGYPAPDSVSPGVEIYIEDNWRNNGSVPMTNPGYIYVTDWYDPYDPDYTPTTIPEGLAARRYNLWADFYAANGNSSVIRPGVNYQVTWQKVFDTTTGEDDFGPYSGPDDAFAFLKLCVDVGSGTRYVEEFMSDDNQS